MNRLQKAKLALTHPELEEWYRIEHGLVADDMTYESVRTYNMGGHGDLADAIIKDGIERGILPDTTVLFEGREIDVQAARSLMDDELCEEIHGTVDNDQEFLEAYIQLHRERFGEDWQFM